MKREDLIKLITDNFAEGEEVSFRYYDEQGTVISTEPEFVVDEHTVIDKFITEYYDGDRLVMTSEDHSEVDEYLRAGRIHSLRTRIRICEEHVVKTKAIAV